MKVRLRGTVRDAYALTLERMAPPVQVELAVQRGERRDLLERAARLSPRYPAAHRDSGVTGRNA